MQRQRLIQGEGQQLGKNLFLKHKVPSLLSSVPSILYIKIMKISFVSKLSSLNVSMNTVDGIDKIYMTIVRYGRE
jgi:hypothetical protein